MGVVRRLAVAWTLVLVATLAPALVAPAQAAGGTSFTGAFWCGRDQRPMAGVRVELWEIWSTGLPKIAPNAWLRHVVAADANGGWGFRVSGDETNWFVRAVFSSAEAEVSQWIWPWNDFADTASNQNDVPLHDYGVQVVQGDQCALWNAMRDASWEYQQLRGQRPPYGEVDVEWNAPNAGAPFAPYDDVWWPGDRSPLGPTPKHEFAHTVRHAHDGSAGHFLADSLQFWYLQHHSSLDCAPTNPGFAFNEGWADYWSRQTYAQCPGRDYRIEATVARSLVSLARSCNLSRQEMLQVLVDNPGRIHSYQEFSNKARCKPRLATPPKKAVSVPTVAQIARATRRTVREGRQWLSAMRPQRAGLVTQYDAAVSALAQPLPCVARPCPEEYVRVARPHLVRAQIAHLDAVRRTMAALARKKVVRKLVRKPARFLTVTQRTRRRALAAGNAAALPHLARAVTAVQAGVASTARDRVLASLGALHQGVAAGDPGTLQGIAWTPPPGLTQGGATPGGVVVVSATSGQPVQSSATTLDGCTSPPEGTFTLWYPVLEDPIYPSPPAVSGTVLPARAGTAVQVVYSHETEGGERRLVRTATTDAQGRFSHWITHDEWAEGYGRVWKVQASFEGDADRLASTSLFCRKRATYP